MFETKNLLMLVILSGGILTGLTGTMIQAAPVYADTEDCKDNDDDNCNTTNERAQEITQENNCRVEDGGRVRMAAAAEPLALAVPAAALAVTTIALNASTTY